MNRSITAIIILLFSSLAANASTQDQFVCHIKEDSKPFFTFIITTISTDKNDLKFEADLQVEESDSYIGGKFKTVQAASFGQTTVAVTTQDQIAMNWGEGSIATAILDKGRDSLYTGIVYFPDGIPGTSLQAEFDYEVRCSNGKSESF